MSAEPLSNILLIGVEALAKKVMEQLHLKTRFMEGPTNLEKLTETKFDHKPDLILCGPPAEGVVLAEMAQLLRMEHPHCSIYYVTTIRDGFQNKVLIKNGFTDAFLLPWDASAFTEALKSTLANLNKSQEKVFRPVKLVDISADASLEFSTYVYLPQNGKHVMFSSSGSDLGNEKLEKLKKHHLSSLHIETTEMPKFYEFTAKRLRELGNSTGISETERQDRLRGAVRGLIGGIFNTSSKDGTIASGKQAMEDCTEIVKSYLTQSNAGWYAKLMNLVGTRTTTYDHSANVATYAAMFSMGMGIGKAEDLAIAGMLHDIGLSELPIEIQMKEQAQLTAEELQIYKTHPEHTVSLIKQRKLIVSDKVLLACAQHHERFNGTGYPKALLGKRICAEAQLLALADRFDELTMEADGQPRKSPIEAIQQIQAECPMDAASAIYDPEILSKLVELFATSS